MTCMESTGCGAHAQAHSKLGRLDALGHCRPSLPGDLSASLSPMLLIPQGKREDKGITQSLQRGMGVFCSSSPRMKIK